MNEHSTIPTFKSSKTTATITLLPTTPTSKFQVSFLDPRFIIALLCRNQGNIQIKYFTNIPKRRSYSFCQMESTRSTTPVVAAASGKVFKLSNRVGRGVPEITDVYNKKCSCRRDKTIVFCRACGYYCNGRIRLKCEQHPRVTFLLDISECPRCHSSVFLDEYVGN